MREIGDEDILKPELHATNTREINATRVSDLLRLAHYTGRWTTAKIVALAMFYEAKAEHRLTYAQRLLATAVTGGYLEVRPLPVRNHAFAYVLTRKGAERIKTELRPSDWRADIRAGTSWGEHTRGKGWRPPKRWRHDERAVRFLYFAANNLDPRGKAAWKPLTESQIRRMSPNEIELFGKCPDGVLVRRGSGQPKAIWVEVEQSQKTGAHRQKLLERLATLAAGNGPLLHIGSMALDYARCGKQAFLVFESIERANTFELAAARWIHRHPGSRLLWQLVLDDGDGLTFRIGKVIDMGTTRNAAASRTSPLEVKRQRLPDSPLP